MEIATNPTRKISTLRKWGIGVLVSPVILYSLGILAVRIIMSQQEIYPTTLGFIILAYVYTLAPISVIAGIIMIIKSRKAQTANK